MKYFALILALGILSCKNTENNTYENSSVLSLKEGEVHPGKRLMETYCYVCHASKDSHNDQIAPPMLAVKNHYLNMAESKEQFIAAIDEWVKNPNQNDALMLGAVKQFGIMPKTLYPGNTVELIADYMYDNKIEEPIWFAEHYQNRKRKGKFRNTIN